MRAVFTSSSPSRSSTSSTRWACGCWSATPQLAEVSSRAATSPATPSWRASTPTPSRPTAPSPSRCRVMAGRHHHSRPRHGPRPSGRRRGDHLRARGRGRRAAPSPTPTAAPTARSSREPTWSRRLRAHLRGGRLLRGDEGFLGDVPVRFTVRGAAPATPRAAPGLALELHDVPRVLAPQAPSLRQRVGPDGGRRGDAQPGPPGGVRRAGPGPAPSAPRSRGPRRPGPR